MEKNQQLLCVYHNGLFVVGAKYLALTVTGKDKTYMRYGFPKTAVSPAVILHENGRNSMAKCAQQIYCSSVKNI